MRSVIHPAGLLLAAAIGAHALASACSGTPGRADAPSPFPTLPSPAAAPPPDISCASGRPMAVHFYDVGQGLAVLVDLPDGRHVLVDAGDAPAREGCGEVCARAHAHLLERLRTDLGGAILDMMWITHPHSDHVGGAADVLARLPVRLYVDNGRDPRKGEVRRAREAAEARGTQVSVVDPAHPEPPLRGSPNVGLTPVVPPAWPRSCSGRGGDENECSIALRIDYCRSSVLLTGDAEHEEERMLDPGRPVTLLQVGHHGSDTSTSPAFLSQTRPLYAVISAGKPDEGLNRDYCHPRANVVQRLSRVLDEDGVKAGLPPSPPGPGDAGSGSLRAFDGTRCDRATAADWVSVPTSDRLWATERDGDVVLVTTGDGIWRRR